MKRALTEDELPPKQRAAWRKVTRYLERHPGTPIVTACRLTRTAPANYFRARERLGMTQAAALPVATDLEAFSFDENLYAGRCTFCGERLARGMRHQRYCGDACAAQGEAS